MEPSPDRLDTLSAAARAGDVDAYRAFLEEAAERLRAFVAKRIGGDADVEDLVQECLIALHEKRDTLDPKRPVAPWMYAIARYKLADRWRRAARRPPPADEVHDVPVPPDSFARRDVEALLARLPAKQAEAVRLIRLQGMTGREASRTAGIGLSAMKLRVHRALIAMRKMVRQGE